MEISVETIKNCIVKSKHIKVKDKNKNVEIVKENEIRINVVETDYNARRGKEETNVYF